jgi:EAL domain-containing protein (putative c-di-GMP-specific phosphodiesterase class I)
MAPAPAPRLAVNASTPEFHAADYLENVRAALEAAHLEPRYLELELTESVLMRDVTSTESALHALTDLGVKLAVNDFGTGYASLSYLRKYPIDTLKIDQSFVNRMIGNPDMPPSSGR